LVHYSTELESSRYRAHRFFRILNSECVSPPQPNEFRRRQFGWVTPQGRCAMAKVCYRRAGSCQPGQAVPCLTSRLPLILPGHGAAKFPTSRLLESSSERGWTGFLAERRAHPAGLLPSFTAPFTEVSLLIRGAAMLTRQADGMYQQILAKPGTIWLSPAGLKEDFTAISADVAEVLHLYLPAKPFASLAPGDPLLQKAELLYFAGFHDPLIEQIAAVVLDEMRSDSWSGRILIQSVTNTLIARLLDGYSSLSATRSAARQRRPQLEQRRLQRVLDFIKTHLESEITVAQLAAAARLSEFHFSRAFKATTGRSPYGYVSDRRMSHAKWLLAETDRSLADIADACRFSSPGNFSRAFQRATGMTPAKFRQASRANRRPRLAL
jgi:AraC family transcriptional regulator